MIKVTGTEWDFASSEMYISTYNDLFFKVDQYVRKDLKYFILDENTGVCRPTLGPLPPLRPVAKIVLRGTCDPNDSISRDQMKPGKFYLAYYTPDQIWFKPKNATLIGSICFNGARFGWDQEHITHPVLPIKDFSMEVIVGMGPPKIKYEIFRLQTRIPLTDIQRATYYTDDDGVVYFKAFDNVIYRLDQETPKVVVINTTKVTKVEEIDVMVRSPRV